MTTRPERRRTSTVQPMTGRCSECDQQRTFTATDTAFEFTWTCPNGHAGVVSWAHANPAPTFESA